MQTPPALGLVHPQPRLQTRAVEHASLVVVVVVVVAVSNQYSHDGLWPIRDGVVVVAAAAVDDDGVQM